MRFICHLCIPGSSLNHDRQQESRVRFSSTSALFSQIALELHIRMAVFINLGWTKNFDHRPQTFCHPSGSSCQSVQSSYSVCFSRGFGGQREDQPGCLFLHGRPHPTHPSSHVYPTKGQQGRCPRWPFSVRKFCSFTGGRHGGRCAMPGGVTGLCLLHLGKNRITTQANGS